MKIISNFTDYYDVMQQYGKDESLVFKRINPYPINLDTDKWILSYLDNQISEDDFKKYFDPARKNFNNLLKHDPIMTRLQSLVKKLNESEKHPDVILQKIIVVVNGIPFKHYVLLERINFDMVVTNKKITAEECFNYLKKNSVKKINNHFNYSAKNVGFEKSKTFKEFEENVIKADKKYKPYISPYYTDVTQEDLIEVHKKTNSPIYIVLDNKVLTNVSLMSLGINDLFDGNMEQLYQEISYCIGNVINNKNEPPIAVSNDVKIQQAGFDEKISFRHRK